MTWVILHLLVQDCAPITACAPRTVQKLRTTLQRHAGREVRALRRGGGRLHGTRALLIDVVRFCNQGELINQRQPVTLWWLFVHILLLGNCCSSPTAPPYCRAPSLLTAVARRPPPPNVIALETKARLERKINFKKVYFTCWRWLTACGVIC